MDLILPPPCELLALLALNVSLHPPGVYTGHTEENFGPEGLERGNEFRTLVLLKLEGGKD